MQAWADKSLLADTAARIRSELVALVYPLASSFEDLGLDANHLFRRLEADKCQLSTEFRHKVRTTFAQLLERLRVL